MHSNLTPFAFAALSPLPAVVRGLTVFSNFECGGPNTTNLFVACAPGNCVLLDGFHSFQNNEISFPQYVRTFENADCASPSAHPPVDFVAEPHICVPAITGRPIESYMCATKPF